MKEIIEFRINNKYAHLLLNENEGKKNASNTIIYVEKQSLEFDQIKILNQQIREKHHDFLFLYSNIEHKYTKTEIDNAKLLHMKINSTFEPAGEECGTIYNESTACKLCGSNREQSGPLKLKRKSIPLKDIARTIAGEVIISKKFRDAFNQRGLSGARFEPIIFDKGDNNYYQLIVDNQLEIAPGTIAGVNVFDMSTHSEAREFEIPGGYKITIDKEIYKCPEGHTIGLNLLSEPYVYSTPSINQFNIFESKQKVGVKRGLLRPEPLYFCATSFKKMIDEEKLSGFDFEVTHIQ